jgi:pyruvate/2-oxoglutarate dehydrogenase complex dihydrolipoamide acyltransferase (E2) component
MADNSYTSKPFPPIRRATIDLLNAASRKHMIHGFIEIDVTRIRQWLKKLKEKTGESLSLTGYIIYCCAKAVDENKHMQACRDWRNRLIIFDDVDVSTTIERLVEGRNEVIPTIIRAANRKSFREIHQDIRQAQSKRADQAGVYRTIKAYLAIPSFIRRLAFRILDRFPHLMKKHSGTIMITSIGMFGSGAGWGLPIASHTLNVTVGGIVQRAIITDSRMDNREHLCVTVSFDHDIIDGAPAARFINRFKSYLDGGTGLELEKQLDLQEQ